MEKIGVALTFCCRGEVPVQLVLSPSQTAYRRTKLFACLTPVTVNDKAVFEMQTFQ